MITFSQLAPGDDIHVLEITGTFKKSTNYCKGVVSEVSLPYEEPLPPQQFSMPNQIRRKLIDVTIACEGENKKLAIEESKSMITDSGIGLTISTNKQLIVDMIKRLYNDYKAKKEAIVRYEDEMEKCENILKQLDYKEEELTKDDPKIKELLSLIEELKDIIKLAGSMVPPLMKLMLPLKMLNAINEAS